MQENNEIGRRIRALRTASEKTLADLSGDTGLAMTYLSNIERGRRTPTNKTLVKIADALGTTLADLIGPAATGSPSDSGRSQRDQLELDLGSAPQSLLKFRKSSAFKDRVADLASETGSNAKELASRILLSMASAPRRSKGEPTEEDWRRLLDTYSVILRDKAR